MLQAYSTAQPAPVPGPTNARGRPEPAARADWGSQGEQRRFYDAVIAQLPARLHVQQLKPKLLAALLGPVVRGPETFFGSSGHASLRDKLLASTVEVARTGVAHYAQSLRELPRDTSYASLLSLPTLTREQVRSQREQLIHRGTHPGLVSFTTGTTSGIPLLVERSAEEQQYIAEFIQSLDAGRPEPELAPRSLHLCSLEHGHTLSIPGPKGYAFIVDVHGASALRRAAWLLDQSFDWPGFEPRVSQVQGSFVAIQRLMSFLRSVGRSGLRLRRVCCFGHYVPRPLREEMEQFFGCPLDDTYSMTEVFSGANYNRSEAAYVFDPFIVEEVLDTQTGRRIETGVGELVVTTLFPFTQRFPLIRYRTGDLVERRWGGAFGDLPCYRPLGRMQNCVYFAAVGQWLGSGQLLEALVGHPELRLPGETSELGATGARGIIPLHRCVAEAQGARLSLELRFSPSAHPLTCVELEVKLRQHLSTVVVPALRDAVLSSDTLRITFLPPGGLASEVPNYFV